MEFQWVTLLYDNLPLLCYRCEIIGHHQWECNAVFTKASLKEESDTVEGYSHKMNLNPRALENRNILRHAFLNSSEYMRYVQFTKLMIQAATQVTQAVPL